MRSTQSSAAEAPQKQFVSACCVSDVWLILDRDVLLTGSERGGLRRRAADPAGREEEKAGSLFETSCDARWRPRWMSESQTAEGGCSAQSG